MGLAAAAVKPIPEGEVPDLLAQLRRHPVLGPRLWGELRSRYGVPGVVAETRPRPAADGSPAGVDILLARGGEPFSDLVVVFPDTLGAAEISVEVSADGRNWEAPLRTDRWEDALWIWDFYERPWSMVRIGGFPSPAAAAPREVFALLSPRHRPLR